MTFYRSGGTRVAALSLLALVLGGCMLDLRPGAESEQTAVRTEPAPVAQWVNATGYAPISLQPGQTQQQKVIMAMRASKLRAYQELAAVIHGQYLYGSTAVQDMVVQSDKFRAAVAGIVRGARVVKSYPVQDDTYATVLEVDLNQVQRAWLQTER